MPPFCAKAADSAARGLDLRAGADGGEPMAVFGQPARRSAAVLVAGMEVAAQVFTPGLVGQANQAALAEQVGGRALPRAPFPQRSIVPQVIDGLAQGVAQEDRRDAAKPADAPLVAAVQRLIEIEGGA